MSWVPITPAGMILYGLAANTRLEAVRRLLKDATHMPYGDWAAFEKRGYRIEDYPTVPAANPPRWYSDAGNP